MNPKKRIFMFYSAFAPLVAVALCCQFDEFFGTGSDEAFANFMFWTVLFTMPLSAWLAVNTGSLTLSCIVVEIATTALGISYMPIAFMPIVIMPLLMMSGLILLLAIDKHRDPKKERLEGLKKKCENEMVAELKRGIDADEVGCYRCIDYGRMGIPLEGGNLPSIGVVYPDVNPVDNGNNPS